MKRFVNYLFFIGLIFLFIAGCSVEEQDISIIPLPVSQKVLKGNFIIKEGTGIVYDNDMLKMSADYLMNYIDEKYGIVTSVSSNKTGNKSVRLMLSDTIKNSEGYFLKIRKNGVEIAGADPAGVFYGIQSLLQLMPPSEDKLEQISVVCADIEDYPRFKWRGQHLDVARHFVSTDFVKNFLDVMAMHKLNMFHWHLTEDQGWRIEIQKYPKLTEIGAWRDSTIIGYNTQYPEVYKKERYGGFYTREEIKEIVEYAKERHITIVPEIEMPGHSLAALAAYPEYSCTGGPFNVSPRWGIFEDVFCAGKEETYEFLMDILDEVIQLFPGEYVHIGGDEVPKDRWEKCKDCQRKIREEGLSNEHELQSYFVKRIENYLHNKGKKLIGWDEILEGGLPERAIVMSWRGMNGGIEAARARHNTVMTPWTPCYFYVYQGKYKEPVAGGNYNLLKDVYEYDPVPRELNENEAKYILGGQGCAWSEYMPEPDIAEYMIFPRLSALSEVLWSEKSQKNWDDFLVRMDKQYLRLDYYDINYRVDYPDNYGFINRFIEDQVTVTLSNVIHGSEIRYTTDGTDPDETSPLYTEPIVLNLSGQNPLTLKSRTFMPNGRKSAVHEGEFVKLEWNKALSPEQIEPGLKYQYFKKEILSFNEIPSSPDNQGTIENIKFPAGIANDFFALTYEGFIKVPAKGVYDFNLSSGSGKAVLYINNINLVDNSADLPRYYEQTGKIALEEGYHKLKLNYLNTIHKPIVKLGCSYNDSKVEDIPETWFYN
jgi:hexosaminidase